MGEPSIKKLIISKNLFSHSAGSCCSNSHAHITCITFKRANHWATAVHEKFSAPFVAHPVEITLILSNPKKDRPKIIEGTSVISLLFK